MISSKTAPTQRDIEAAEWCLGLSERELSVQELAAFDAWICDEANATALEEATRVWRAAGQSLDMPEVLRVRADAVARLQRAQRQRWRRPFSRRWIASGIAAVAATIVAAIMLLQPPSTIYSTQLGERQVAMLPDGSRLSLDADTVVRVKLLRDRRDLTLERGRAKFDVARDPLRPFAVTAGGKVVVATGTSFSVELLAREARVLLYEGHVAVMDAGPSGSGDRTGGFTDLRPGRELVTDLNEPIAAPRVFAVDAARSLSWEGGQLNFEDEPLASAVQRINRYSKRRITLSDPVLNAIPVNGVFDADDTDAFVEALTAFHDIRAVEGDEGVTLRPS